MDFNNEQYKFSQGCMFLEVEISTHAPWFHFLDQLPPLLDVSC